MPTETTASITEYAKQHYGHMAQEAREEAEEALLGIIAPDADAATRDPFPLGPSDGVPEEWYAWYRAWRATGSRGLAPRIARHYGGYILCAGDGWPGGTLTSYRRSNGRRSWRSRCGPLCLRKPTTSSLVRWAGRTSSGGGSSADA